ncbi:hypothetical protein [Aurantiacibacter rhizosphaerae]|uniref:Uncharacterized protein n=1 Tax=Aurantiacibacter rhizosphaerae TaxID=2691582 RepID=A0A844XBP9_9SPHN|nr:hypothetical protein [Aurantiacibacter rhizosphaerae]MWV27064.1 hypothetical protein [Aurantiacibacter rhizosphaerae]
MEELKARVNTIDEIVGGIRRPKDAKDERHNHFLFEGLYLHLRKVCELIALSMLLVHRMDGSANAGRLLKEWRADRLIDELTRMNPIGFPKRIDRVDALPGTTHEVNENPPLFTAKEIKALYHRCGDLMHVGSLRSVLNNRIRELNQFEVQEWVAKFKTGLANHMIVIPSTKMSLIVVMEDTQTKRVSCQFAKFAE